MAIIGKFVGCRCSQIIQPAAVGWRCRPISQHLKTQCWAVNRLSPALQLARRTLIIEAP